MLAALGNWLKVWGPVVVEMVSTAVIALFTWKLYGLERQRQEPRIVVIRGQIIRETAYVELVLVNKGHQATDFETGEVETTLEGGATRTTGLVVGKEYLDQPLAPGGRAELRLPFQVQWEGNPTAFRITIRPVLGRPVTAILARGSAPQPDNVFLTS